jgi:uncharacterized protein YcfJ
MYELRIRKGNQMSLRSRKANFIARHIATLVLVSGGVGLCSTAFAQENARVISATPILQKVGTPQQVCSDQQVLVQGQKSGTGAVLGAIAGGAVGESAGHGRERGASTVLGAIGGAIVGNELEGRSADTVQTVRQCTTQTVYQDKVVAFNVVYEYAGKQYSVQSPQDPGPYLAVQVVPILPGKAEPVMIERRRAPRY